MSQLGPRLSDAEPTVRLQAAADLKAGTGAGLTNLGSRLDALANAGALNFPVPNLPDPGITPIARFLKGNGRPGTMDLLTGLSLTYKQGISTLPAPLRNNPLLPATTLDIFALNRAVLANA